MENENINQPEQRIDKYGNVIEWSEPEVTNTTNSGLDEDGNLPVFDSKNIKNIKNIEQKDNNDEN